MCTRHLPILDVHAAKGYDAAASRADLEPPLHRNDGVALVHHGLQIGVVAAGVQLPSERMPLELRRNRRLPSECKKRWTTLRLDVHDSNNWTEPNDVTYPKRLTGLDAHAVDRGSRSRTEIFDCKLFVSSDQRRVHSADLRVVQIHVGLAPADRHPGRSDPDDLSGQPVGCDHHQP